jgi:hypothetical protein
MLLNFFADRRVRRYTTLSNDAPYGRREQPPSDDAPLPAEQWLSRTRTVTPFMKRVVAFGRR